MQFITHIEDGKLSNKYVREWLANCPKGWYSIEVKKWNKRSILQNNYYWFILEIIGDDLWYTKNEMHDIFRNMFLKREVKQDEVFGDLTIVRSTSSLTTIEFMQYIDQIIIRSGGNWISVPAPEKDLYPSQYTTNG